MRKFLLAVALSITIPLSAFAAAINDPQKEVNDSLQNYASAWNQGNLKEVVNAYDDSNATIFISENIIEGYKNIEQFFNKNYATQTAMGKMSFSDVKVKIISRNYAMAVGKWAIARTQGDNTNGTFTVLYERTNKGWKIAIDHASAEL